MNKKVIIIEGCDCVGKDSLINELKLKFNNPVIIHACVPNSNDIFSYYYNGLIHSTLENYYNDRIDAVIHNRSMYGEYVYGPKYRNESLDYIKKVINKLEIGQLKTFISENELYFILLTSTDVDLIVDNSDGKSLSDRREDIEYEVDAFNKVFKLSTIKNKKIVYVNNGNQFRDKRDIYDEVYSFINKESK